mmetsp:Transcript_27704/g.78405  ORF Transcript_27704/g.78405 Transcript_27704/m.78405 type:complete len:721 (+) Transcript_27704:134-2296(+)
MNVAYLRGIGIPVGTSAIHLSESGVDPKRTAASSSGAKQASAPENPNYPPFGLYPGVPVGSSKPFGFLQEWIDIDLAQGGLHSRRKGKSGDVVRTRFPPEPNGYLHIGHAKAIIINFGLAQLYGGRCHLRFDDTNPAAEETEYVESIMEDVRWLGYDWGEHLCFASGYFDQLYEWAEHLVKEGKAYVDSETQQEMRAKRRAGEESKYRNRSPEENLKIFREMRDGKYKEGEHFLRMKGDMKAASMAMRDMPIYRILHQSHHRTGDKWCVYPLYDFAHGQEDAIEGITHSICTLEFEGHRELYNWFTENLPVKERPRQLEMSRLNVTTFLTSKRKLIKLVQAKVVDGWDDPRMSTLSGLRRRGVTPEALKTFIMKVGVTRSISVTDVALLEDCIRLDLEPQAPRRMVVLDPLKVVVEDYPEDREEEVEASNHPSDPKMGSRKLGFSREVWIERTDFREDAPDSYFRLKPGGEVKLRYSYVIKVKDVVKNASGDVVELRCTHDPATRDTMPTDRKVKGVIHWVSAKHCDSHKVRLYTYLIPPESAAAAEPEAAQEEEAAEEGLEEATEDAEAKMKAFLAQVDPNSVVELTAAKLERSLSGAKPFDRFQFERNGFFVVDKYSAPGGPLVFNRTIDLKKSGYEREEAVDAIPRSRKGEQDKLKAEKEAKKSIDPRQMFRAQADLYSKFDENGIPTHDQAGEPINKTRCKKLKQEWEKQKKLFES